MTELRIIIAVIGLLILALIYYFGTRKKPQDDFEDLHVEPLLDSFDEKVSLPEKPTKQQVKSRSIDSSSPQKQTENKIVTLFLHAKEGQQFDWHLIKSAAEKAGLEYGDDHLFYRYREVGKQKDFIFMVANMLKPGIFHPDMRTTGLVLIMTLPAAMPALDMWDMMFPVGKRMAELLSGKLTDENHNVFSNQRIASMREEMREFDHKTIIS